MKKKNVLTTIVLVNVQFSTLNFSEAIETRHALHGIRWPTSNPKCLNVDFGTESLMDKAVASTADDVKPNILCRDDRIVSSNDFNESNREKVDLFIYFDIYISIISPK